MNFVFDHKFTVAVHQQHQSKNTSSQHLLHHHHHQQQTLLAGTSISNAATVTIVYGPCVGHMLIAISMLLTS